MNIFHAANWVYQSFYSGKYSDLKKNLFYKVTTTLEKETFFKNRIRFLKTTNYPLTTAKNKWSALLINFAINHQSSDTCLIIIWQRHFNFNVANRRLSRDLRWLKRSKQHYNLKENIINNQIFITDYLYLTFMYKFRFIFSNITQLVGDFD